MAVYNMTTAFNGYGDIMGAEHMDLEREHVSISKASQLTARANKEDKKVLLQISYLLDKKKQQKNKKDMVDYHSSFKNEDYESKIGCDPDLISYGSTTCSTITHSNYSHDSASVDLVDDDSYSIQSPDESHYGGDQELDDPLLQHQGPPRNKTEERALKRIRRKIKNKLSAQESRRKKKEYLENLENTVVSCTSENGLLKEQVSSLNNTVRQLLRELKRIQEAKKPSQDQGTQTGICLKCHLHKSSTANNTHHKS